MQGKVLEAIRNDVVARVNRLFEKTAQSQEPRLRLSQLGLCPRMTVLSIQTGITADLTEAAGILAAGHLYEQFIAEAFEGEEVIPQYEVVLAGVTGHIDFYFPQRLFFIECKTIAAAKVSDGFLPVDHHVVQVHAYLSALYEMTNERHYAALIYFPRENPRKFEVFTFTYDEAWHSELIIRIELLKHAIETGEVPPVPADYSPNKFPCRWFSRISRILITCPFFERCYGTASEQPQQPAPTAAQESSDEFREMDAELEDLVAYLHSLRTQKKQLEEQEKAARQEILERIKSARGRWVGREFGLLVKDEERRVLDTKALAKVVNLDEYRRVSVATVVDVWKIR